MFGSSNYNFCALLTLSTFLELYYPVDTNENDQVNIFTSITSTTATGNKQKISRYLKKIFMSKKFGAVTDLINKIVGSHSIWKFTSTLARTAAARCIGVPIKYEL